MKPGYLGLKEMFLKEKKRRDWEKKEKAKYKIYVYKFPTMSMIIVYT